MNVANQGYGMRLKSARAQASLRRSVIAQPVLHCEKEGGSYLNEVQCLSGRFVVL